jgi:hypothetical protein
MSFKVYFFHYDPFIISRVQLIALNRIRSRSPSLRKYVIFNESAGSYNNTLGGYLHGSIISFRNDAGYPSISVRKYFFAGRFRQRAYGPLMIRIAF